MRFSNRQSSIFTVFLNVALIFFFTSCSGGGSDTPVSQLPKEWGEAEMIETDNTGAADSPQIAMDDNGNAIAVWKQYDGSVFHIWASYFDGRTWGAAEIIEIEDNTGNSDSPQIAMNNDGNAITVWSQHDGFRYNIWANYFDGSAWGTAEMIETDNNGSATLPQIAMNDKGNAIAVWEQRDGNRNIWANYFDGSAWGTARLIEFDDTGNAYYPQIAMKGEGNAYAVWSQYDGFNYDIWVNNFDGTTWGTAEVIDTTNIGSAYSPQIAVDLVGDAVSVWEQDDSFRYNIWANFLDADVEEGEVAEWGIGIPIEAEKTNDAESPQVAMDDNGNAIAVWMQYDGSRYNVWANYFDGTAWGAAELIETVDTGGAESPQIAMDGEGDAIAVWRQFDGFRYNIWANNFDSASWWSVAELIETGDTGNAESPQIAIDDEGNAIAVWRQFDGSKFSIYANRFE